MKLIKLSLAAALAVTMAYAEETSDLGISANVSATNNYVWRGMTQTDNSPAIQGGFDLDYKGFYAGVWASNVSLEGYEASMEADIYAGYAGEIAGVGFDLGVIQYMYPNNVDELNFAEAYVGLSYDFKVVEVGATYYQGIDTNDVDVAAENWEPENAWEVSASVPLPAEFSVDATYGDYDSLGAYYLVGVNRSFGKFDFTLAYTANDGNGDSAAEQDNFVGSISTSF